MNLHRAPLDDDELVAQYVAAEDPERRSELFTEFYQRWRGYVLSHIARNRQVDAEDHCQELMMWLQTKGLTKYGGSGKLKPWLKALSSRQALSPIRKAARRGSKKVSFDFDALSKGQSPEQKIIIDETGHALRNLIKRLPKPERKVIKMLFYYGYTLHHTAETLDMTLKRVWRLKERALKRLRSPCRPLVVPDCPR